MCQYRAEKGSVFQADMSSKLSILISNITLVIHFMSAKLKSTS